MADETTTTPETRPLVPYLKLGDTRDQDYLFGSKCKNCGNVYLGSRESCGKCSTMGPFDEVKLSRDGKIHVWSIIHQAPPYAKTPYTAAVVDLADGVAVNTNIDVEPKPELRHAGANGDRQGFRRPRRELIRRLRVQAGLSSISKRGV